MTAYDPARYGKAVGNDYDSLYPGDPDDTQAAVDYIAELAESHPSRSILEFGIGTGRLALPLARRGLRVAGIDGSQTMLDQLRTKPGAEDIDLTVGDYRTTQVPSTFSVVVLAWNGIFDPRGLDAQLDIFANARNHLGPGGHFVVETWVMTDQQRDGQWHVMPRYVTQGHVELQLSRYDIATNSIERTLIHLRPEGPTFVTVTDTYASPSELDILAHTTGLHRSSRHATWRRDLFTATSRNCISTFRLS